jgi:hypothetical protein
LDLSLDGKCKILCKVNFWIHLILPSQTRLVEIKLIRIWVLKVDNKYRENKLLCNKWYYSDGNDTYLSIEYNEIKSMLFKGNKGSYFFKIQNFDNYPTSISRKFRKLIRILLNWVRTKVKKKDKILLSLFTISCF